MASFGNPVSATYTELPSSDQIQKRPLVSIIIPVFNRAKSLAAALRSVSEQTFQDWETIVVDDCSSDDSAKVALQVGPPGKVRVIRHEKNLGSSAARNTGIFAARGQYVSFLDSDDLWHPAKLRRQVELVEADSDPSTVFCITQTEILRGGWRMRVLPKRAPLPEEPWSEYLYMNGGFAQTSSFFLSRDLAMKVGFRSNLFVQEDHLFFLAAGAHGARVRLIAEPLNYWNDDSRADRISFVAHTGRSRRFLEEGNGLITEKARLAFEVRHLGPALFREHPLEAIRLFQRASRSGVMQHRHLLSTYARCVLPRPAVTVLRSILYSLTG